MERLKSLRLLTLKSRRSLLGLIFFYKCLKGLLNINLSRFTISSPISIGQLKPGIVYLHVCMSESPSLFLISKDFVRLIFIN